jgi:hypothetical protein
MRTFHATAARTALGLGIIVLGAVTVQRAGVGTASTPVCGDVGNTEPVDDGFPERMSSLVGSDIRTGGHDCFERVVIEFAGSGDLPGYWVRYESDPIIQSPSGQPVEVAGDATLVVSVASWMPDTEGNGYQGPSQIFPTNVSNIAELRQIENFEGMHQWAIGLDRERGFAVMTLTEPVRIVIDIELDDVPPPTTQPATTPPVVTATPPAPAQPPASVEVSTFPRTDHPLVGSWLVLDESYVGAQPALATFSSDGIYHQADAQGLNTYGTWEPTGPSSAALTAVQLVPDATDTATITARGSIDVSPDGQRFIAAYTLEITGSDLPPGQYGPGSASAIRIRIETMGTPEAPLDELIGELATVSTTPS